MKPTILYSVAALAAGVALGAILFPVEVIRDGQDASKPSSGRHALAEAGESATVEALKARIRELERRLAGKPFATNAAERAEEAVAKEDGDRPGRHRSPREWMEKLRKENPEQYTQMTNGMARFRRFRRETAAAKSEVLSSVDTSRLSSAERENHAKLQELIAKREELREKMDDSLDMSEEDRRALFDEMRETDHALREANRTERTALLKATGSELGLSDDDTQAFAETVEDIVELTNEHTRMPPPQDGGGQGGGQGGGPGGPGPR